MKRPPDARTLALEALQAVERREAFADAVLDGVLRRNPALAPAERSLATQLVYGVLRWRNRLDAHLSSAASRPLGGVHPLLLQILRLGAFQILFLDRVPDRAAVNEAVELARRKGMAHTTGFVNAVLRRVAAGGRDIPLPEGAAERLALLFGCPGWLVERWGEEHGPEGAELLCRAASRIPPLWLRLDTSRMSRREAVATLAAEGVEAVPGARAPEALWLPAGGAPSENSLVERGLAVVQDQASQLVAHLVAPRPGWRILDACAGPGLKATHLAALAGAGGRVEALDVHAHRTRRVSELADRLGYAGVSAHTADARQYRTDEPFDAVLVDAPCSGLGVLGRNPEAKWRRDPASLEDLPRLQGELLRNLADAVRPGGVLVYATCTTLRAENESAIESLLAERPDFRREPPPAGGAAWDGLLTEEGCLRTYPEACAAEGAEALDGFFGARLRRRGST